MAGTQRAGGSMSNTELHEKKVLVENQSTVYSLDIAPSNYHLFRSRNRFLRCIRFTEVDDVTAVVSGFFRSKPTGS